MSDTKEPLKLYLDEQTEPFKVDHPPLRFPLSTLPLADGDHVLRVEASNGLAPPTIKEIPFRVRNGVAVTVSGLEPDQTIGGQVELIVNAYAGNTEVDFEPRRAETPQPIPTWAWVLGLGVLVWSLFYIMNPVQAPRDAAATTFEVGRELGERLYMDTCARCHGEDGRGRLSEGSEENYLVNRLRDTPRLALEETPYSLLRKIVTGTRATGNVQMPPWGPRMTNEEIVAVTNFVRTSWGHDASQILPKYRRPPAGVEQLEESILQAMVEKDVAGMSHCCWPKGARPQLYRIDGPRWAVGREEVLSEWKGYFEALEGGRVVDFQLTDVRYDYEPEAVDEVGSYVFAMGRIFLRTENADGLEESDKGRFIRLYRRMKNGTTDADGTPGSQWALLFDFASIRMRVGCEVEEDCPPGQEPGGAGHDPTDPPLPVPDDGSGSEPAATGTGGVGYKALQALFRALERDPGDAGHERFWDVSYEDFINSSFPFSWENAEETVQLLEVGNSKESNLIKALVDGKGIKVRLENGDIAVRTIKRMPKGGAGMPAEQIKIIADWIDAGCPQYASKAPADGGAPKDSAPKDGAPKDGAAAPAGALGYADVQAIFKALGRDAGDSPHERFWELPHAEFCDLAFPLSWDDVDSMIPMITPYDGEGSNLVRALRDGKGISYTDGDGNKKRTNIKRMPKGGAAMPEADVLRIAAWIDAGCPKTAGGAPYFAQEEAPKDAPKDAPKEAPQDAPQDAPKDARKKSAARSDLGFDQVMKIFKDLRQKAPNAPHSNYWKELDYAEFIAFRFPLKYGQPGDIRMLVPWDSAASNMMRAFKDGKGIVVDLPGGGTKVVDIEPMPKDADPIPPETMAKLAAWIDAGCPEFAGKPSALPKGGAAPTGTPPAPP
ncbi:MAG: c-type cytochrome, partial [Planctomycetota bacterium]|nr:c-type cytochrome [Planctomycetota bacterium]